MQDPVESIRQSFNADHIIIPIFQMKKTEA